MLVKTTSKVKKIWEFTDRDGSGAPLVATITKAHKFSRHYITNVSHKEHKKWCNPYTYDRECTSSWRSSVENLISS